jgi:hypothetical protein
MIEVSDRELKGGIVKGRTNVQKIKSDWSP